VNIYIYIYNVDMNKYILALSIVAVLIVIPIKSFALVCYPKTKYICGSLVGDFGNCKRDKI
jgi:hypothetical protein